MPNSQAQFHTRKANDLDRGFVYSLFREHMQYFFDAYTYEGWSDEKFNEDFNSDNIIIIEREGIPVGFLETRIKTEIDRGYLYVCNIHLRKECRGYPYFIKRLTEEEARKKGLGKIRAKIFLANERTLRFVKMMGYKIILEIPDENSVLVERVL